MKHRKVFLIGGFDPPTQSDTCMIVYALRLIALQECYQGATLHVVVLNSPMHDYFFDVSLRQSFVEELCQQYNALPGITIQFHVCDAIYPIHAKIVHDLGGGVLISPVRDTREDIAILYWDLWIQYCKWNTVIHKVACNRPRWLIKASQVRSNMHMGKWDIAKKMIPVGLFPFIKTAFCQEKKRKIDTPLLCGSYQYDTHL